MLKEYLKNRRERKLRIKLWWAAYDRGEFIPKSENRKDSERLHKLKLAGIVK